MDRPKSPTTTLPPGIYAIDNAQELCAALREFVRTAEGIARDGATPNWLGDLSDNLEAARAVLAEADGQP